MAEKKKKSKNDFWIQVLLMIAFLAGLLIMLYPFYVESINNFIDNQRIEEAQKLDAKRNAKELAKLRAENERAAKKAAKDPFRGTGNMNAKKLRRHLLGRVVIPKINVNVPLFNLTTADTLNYGAAVLQGSSFPTGGKGKRTVIAAHRGLPERKLFTDLDEVKKGDLFVISVYGKNMAYKVYNIKVIKPNKVKSLLPVKDKDLATLMTCTPYGVNTQRLLISGHREPIPMPAPDPSDLHDTRTIMTMVVVCGLLGGWLLLGVIGRIRRLPFKPMRHASSWPRRMRG